VEESQCSPAPNFDQGERWRPKSNLPGRLRKDAEDPAFQGRFGRLAALARRDADEHVVEIHQAKLDESLRDALRDTDLAWFTRAEAWTPCACLLQHRELMAQENKFQQEGQRAGGAASALQKAFEGPIPP
jgi:hypothetical protein